MIDEQITSLDFEETSQVEVKTEELYTLKTNDNDEVRIKKSLLRFSEVLKVCLEDKDEDNKDVNIDVSKDVLLVIIDYLKFLENNKPGNIPKPLLDTTLKSYISEWEIEYVNNLYKNKMLKSVCKASNYLFISSLFELCCAKIATLLKGKVHTPELENILATL